MWKYNNTDELYHYGVIGMHWGIRKAANNFYKAGKQYGKYLKQKNRINALNKKAAKSSVTGNNKNSEIHVDMNRVARYEQKINRLSQKGNKYINKMNLYNKKAVTTMNKYNIKKGEDFIYKHFDTGVINGYSNKMLPPIVGSSLATRELSSQGYDFNKYRK